MTDHGYKQLAMVTNHFQCNVGCIYMSCSCAVALLCFAFSTLQLYNLLFQQFDHAGQATDVKIIGTDEYIADDENKKPFKDKVGCTFLKYPLHHCHPNGKISI